MSSHLLDTQAGGVTQPDLDRGWPPAGLVETDERALRRQLRGQIAELERELQTRMADSFPRRRTGIEWSMGGSSRMPRIQSTAELERTRDALAGHVEDARRRMESSSYVETKKRELIEEMVRAPAEHKFVHVSNEDIGEPGCKHWHSLPRYGFLGMLLGWWRVKISSGCPLATGRGFGPAPAAAARH